jgi:hypothetical protein
MEKKQAGKLVFKEDKLFLLQIYVNFLNALKRRLWGLGISRENQQ